MDAISKRASRTDSHCHLHALGFRRQCFRKNLGMQLVALTRETVSAFSLGRVSRRTSPTETPCYQHGSAFRSQRLWKKLGTKLVAFTGENTPARSQH